MRRKVGRRTKGGAGAANTGVSFRFGLGDAAVVGEPAEERDGHFGDAEDGQPLIVGPVCGAPAEVRTRAVFWPR
jgi:hypothetical protein